jgi:hypothetical protein
MGWNTNVIIARDRTLEAVLPVIPDVYSATDTALDFDAATSPRLAPSLAIGESARASIWGPATDVVIFDPLGKLADNYDGWLNRLSGVHPVIVLWLAAVESRYGIAVFDMTKETCRLSWSGNELVASSGSHPAVVPGEIEIPAWGCDETVLFSLVERLSGPSAAAVSDASYRRMDFG